MMYIYMDLVVSLAIMNLVNILTSCWCLVEQLFRDFYSIGVI